MKKLNYLLLLIPIFLMSCSGDDGSGEGKQIGLNDLSQQTQQAYADEETTGGFSFTAHSSWTATVRETTPARSSSSGVSWLRLLLNGTETYSGGAGTFTLAIEIDVNPTGATRSATITIKSGSDSITITVTQEGTTEDGEVPEDPGEDEPERNKGGIFAYSVTGHSILVDKAVYTTHEGRKALMFYYRGTNISHYTTLFPFVFTDDPLNGGKIKAGTYTLVSDQNNKGTFGVSSYTNGQGSVTITVEDDDYYIVTLDVGVSDPEHPAVQVKITGTYFGMITVE